jgi:hypothetical protein
MAKSMGKKGTICGPNTLTKQVLHGFGISHEFGSVKQDIMTQFLDCEDNCEVNFLFMIVLHFGILVVVIDVNPSNGFWTARLIKVFGHEGKCK